MQADSDAEESAPKKKKKLKAPKSKVKGPSSASILAGVNQEGTFWEGPPSKTELIIPGASLITVVGIIPLGAGIARQVWTTYKFTNRRVIIKSGFQGSDRVQISYREITDVKWLRRWGGKAGDFVFTVKDGSKVEVRSVPDPDRILCFIFEQLDDVVKENSFFPDKQCKEYLAKVAAGEEPPLEIAPPEIETAS
jgi:hypothetical protein